MIDRFTIARIMDAAKIEEIIADYVTLKRSGSNLKGLCPFHDEKTGSFMVSPAKGIFKCFGCGKSGQAVSFLMEYEKCSYPEALRMLAKRYHIEIQERELSAEEQQEQSDREAMLLVNSFANDWFQRQLESPDGQAIALSYFHARGLSDTIIKKFQLGFAPKGNKLSAAARAAGYKDEYLLKTGLCCKSERNGELYDNFRDRVIYPFQSVSGKAIAFAGRVINMQEHADKKYVNSPESEVYTKGSELFGLYLAKSAITKQDRCFIVEGQMDVISMHQAGLENVVCSGGTSLTEKQIRLIRRFTSNVTLIFDGDKAGINASLRGIDLLLKEGMNVKVLLLPDGKDPDQFAKENNADTFIAYFNEQQVDFIQYIINVLKKDAGDDPIKKAKMVNQVADSIARIPDFITRQIYTKEAAARFELDELGVASTIKYKHKAFVEDERQRKQTYEERTISTPQTPANDSLPPFPQIETKNQTGISVTTYGQLLKQMISSREDINIVNIMRTMAQLGHKTFCETTNGPISVGAYIIQNLETDEYEVKNPLFARFFAEYKQHMDEPDFIPETYFTQLLPNDLELTQLVIELVTDNEVISKMYSMAHSTNSPGDEVEGHDIDEDKLAKDNEYSAQDEEEIIRNVPRLLLELKYTLVDERIKDAQNSIKEMNNDPTKQEELLSYLKYQIELEQLKKYLNEQLGR